MEKISNYIDWALKSMIVFVGGIGLHFLYGIDSKLGVIESKADRAAQDIQYMKEDVREIKEKDAQQDDKLSTHDKMLFRYEKDH